MISQYFPKSASFLFLNHVSNLFRNYNLLNYKCMHCCLEASVRQLYTNETRKIWYIGYITKYIYPIHLNWMITVKTKMWEFKCLHLLAISVITTQATIYLKVLTVMGYYINKDCKVHKKQSRQPLPRANGSILEILCLLKPHVTAMFLGH